MLAILRGILFTNAGLKAALQQTLSFHLRMQERLHKRLLLVSNRLPFQLQEKGGKVTLKQSDGGLVSALKSYFDDKANTGAFDQKVWVGTGDFPKERWDKFVEQEPQASGFNVEPLFVDTKTYNKYYNGFCNATLWPLFHYFPSYTVYEQPSFEAYERVNALFAERLLKIVRPGDTLWIHDYQLFLLPSLIREKIPDVTIGFFLHIPFPSYEMFRLLHTTWKQKIVQGILGADLVGFHTHEYVQHFLKTVRMVAGLDHQFGAIPHKNRMVKVDLFPLGVDVKKFSATVEQDSVQKRKAEIQKNFKNKKLIFSVDRLDYTKGVTHRLAGYERFLTQHPEWCEKVVFVLAVVPSREIISKYNERRVLIEEQVGRLNGKYSSLSWEPVIYRYSRVGFEELCALYAAANAAIITPLRDGMNLVAKEYVASRNDHEGVLILSEFAGAAAELGEALLVNPMDTQELSDAIARALTMPLEEQQRKMKGMQQRLNEYDVTAWVNDFLQQLDAVKLQQQNEQSKFITRPTRLHMIHRYRVARARHLFLDYDGTLVPFARFPKDAKPDANLLKLLTTLGNDTRNKITLISGRGTASMEEWFGSLPVNLVAEHGAAVKRVGQGWQYAGNVDQTWKPVVRPTVDMFVKRCPGSFVEEKTHTLAWHYRNVNPDLGFTRSRELIESLHLFIRNANLQVIDGNKVVEVRVAGVDKGSAARHMLELEPADFVLAIGDDKTDEDMFRALAEHGVTVKVGDGHSAAQNSVPGQRDVIHLLGEFANASVAAGANSNAAGLSERSREQAA